MSSYVAADWHDFFIAAVGASAALLGLLFVTVSINLDEILKFPHLPGRAAATLGILLTVLVVAFLANVGSELKTSKVYANGSSVKLLAQSAVNLVQSEINDATH